MVLQNFRVCTGLRVDAELPMNPCPEMYKFLATDACRASGGSGCTHTGCGSTQNTHATPYGECAPEHVS